MNWCTSYISCGVQFDRVLWLLFCFALRSSFKASLCCAHRSKDYQQSVLQRFHSSRQIVSLCLLNRLHRSTITKQLLDYRSREWCLFPATDSTVFTRTQIDAALQRCTTHTRLERPYTRTWLDSVAMDFVVKDSSNTNDQKISMRSPSRPIWLY